ncbi:S8 family serine peptidase [Isoptericola dokdonensis]|uniref:Subtilisin BPN n=1 Tax=Isoptericola dokdonensis DS-3 TaxID=1300344 RepID=A0A168FLH4_9MICO|nr:S8 family serine peptidase [Isoptericola dokdonensis]ANC32079.1 Subtilisin BPN' precursor [Isoptericola dokdonensis DS-3]
MRPLVRAGIAATAAGAALAAGVLPGWGANPPTETDPDTSAHGEATTVTLVTGDVVRVTTTADGQEVYAVEPAPGSTGTAQTLMVGDDTYVLPDAALPYLASGALDQELFNVSDLVEFGYDDASGGIPVIAQHSARLRSAPRAPAGSEKVLDLPSVDATALVRAADEADEFWAAVTGAATTGRARAAVAPGTLAGGLTALWLDGRVESTLDVSVPLVGAPEAWAGGNDGTGARVAVLDSGVDPEHPDLVDAVTTMQSFVPGEEVTDANGHGTHVASTVAGSGAASDGRHTGVAPGAELAVGKVLGDDGYGQDSWIIAGMEWAVTQADADVVSMSLGDDSRTDQTDPIAQSLNALSAEHDTLFVVAAGNAGAVGSVHSPGTADAALTIAATDDRDARASFSSQGPRGLDDGLKPDMAAPGVGITAARSQFSSGSGAYRSLNGTSMATPHVAGAAALLTVQHPDWGAQRLKDALMSSTHEIAGTHYEVGTGRLDVPAALDDIAATGSVYFGMVSWGDADPEPQTRTITYTNDTDADVALDLTTATDGATDVVRLSAAEVVVPAHGSASVEATASYADAPEPGHYLGEVVATDAAGTVVARTSTGLTRETEKYDLDVTVLDLAGKPVVGAQIMGYDYQGARFGYWYTGADGSVGARRVEPGAWAVSTKIRVADADGTDRLFWLADPRVDVVDGDVSVVLDAREATEVRLDTPLPSEAYAGRIDWYHAPAEGTSLLMANPVNRGVETWVLPTDDVPDGELYTTARWSRTAPLLDLRAWSPQPRAIEPVYQSGSTRLDGRVDLRVVTAGEGTPAEIAAVDATGKALVVTAGGDVTPAARAAAAQAAGAELLVVVADGPGTLFEPAGGTTLPVVSVSVEEGERLLSGSSKGRLRGWADAFPEYAYDYAHTWEGSTPERMVLAPRTRDLAQVTDRFVDTQERIAFLSRADCPDYLLRCQAIAVPWQTADEHVTFLSAGVDGAGTVWGASVLGENLWDVRDTTRQYAPGERDTLNWFGVAAPRQGDGFWKSSNTGTMLRMNVPPASPGGGMTGTFGSGRTVASRLYHDDTLLRSASSQAMNQLRSDGTGPQTYRYEMDVTVDPSTWAWSSRTSTAWTFVTDRAAPGDLPLLGVEYDVPTRLDGTVRGGRTTVGLTVGHVPDAVGTGTVTDVALEVSYDEGATWSDATVRTDGDGWSAQLRTPKSADSVSLRTTAHDDAGNAVTQEVVRAFGVS